MDRPYIHGSSFDSWIVNFYKDFNQLTSQEKAMLRNSLEAFLTSKGYEITSAVRNAVKCAVMNKYNGKSGTFTAE